MFIRAFITMVAADAVDRQMREQQHRRWVAAEEARAASANGLARRVSAAPAAQTPEQRRA
jgi:hypothetical protein